MSEEEKALKRELCYKYGREFEKIPQFLLWKFKFRDRTLNLGIIYTQYLRGLDYDKNVILM